MIDVILAEHHDLLPIFHKSLLILMHTIHKHIMIEVFLHLCDIDNATVCQFLKFGVVDIGAVHCRYLIALVMAWNEHERVEPQNHHIQHCQQMSISVETLDILLSVVFTAHFNYFYTVERFYQLAVYRLSEEICTFTHGYSWIVWRHQNNHLELTPANGISPIFLLSPNV